MDDGIRVDILNCLCELIKDPPYFFLGNLLAFCLGLGDEILQAASLAVFHDNIDSNILLVDFVIEVPEDMDVFHAYEGVDFVDDMFLLLGGKGRKGDLLENYCLLIAFGLGLEELLALLLHDFVSLLHF